ncbi:Glu/Leu/Phe/Val dehydrogenase [candidate division KSB1 bacterium]
MIEVLYNPYKTVLESFDKAAKLIDLDEYIVNRIRMPERELSVYFPVKLSDGSIKMFNGFRVQHSSVRGPAVGGVRFHPSVNLDEMRALSTSMTLKCAMVNIPFSGAAGGVKCYPKELDIYEIERMTRRYAAEISIIIGPDKDIVVPDIYTNSQIMAWIMDTFSMTKGYCIPGVVAGKPIDLGGSFGGGEATGRGCVYTLLEAAKQKNISIDGCKAAVLGLGETGSIIAGLLSEKNTNIVAVSDSKGGIYNKNGLDINKVLVYKNEYESVIGYPESETVTNEELLTLDCDLLIPAALENVISAKNADNIKAQIIGEAASCPTTPEADEILIDKGIYVIPDIIASAGGAIVSYFEWVQNINSIFWNAEDVNKRLKDVILQSYWKAVANAETYKTDLRTSSIIIASQSIKEALNLRGIYP